MADNISLVRIFIASPTGLEAERRLVRDIAEEINETHVEHWRCEIKIVGWEDTIIGYRRPQDRINQDLDKCDYFFGILYNRWGSPPSLPGEGYSSGFEEEYNRAISRKQNGYIKDVALFFRVVDIPTGLEPGADIKRVREFRQQCIDEKRVFFFDYNEIEQFRSAVRKKIFDIGWAESNNISEIGREIVEPDRVEGKEKSQLTRLYSPNGLFQTRSAQFLTSMSSRIADWDGRIASDIARMRLIALSVSRPGNDESYLGAHDANLVFKTFRDEVLSEQEYRALSVCGVAAFAGHNVPIWHWIAELNGRDKPFGYIAELAVWGSDALRLNALRILESARQEIPNLGEEIPKELMLRSWFSDSANDQIFAAANRFLSHCATLADIPQMEAALEAASPSRKAEVELSIVAVLARSDAKAALRRILERDLDGAPDMAVDRIFSDPSALETETVRLCLSARADGVRRKAVQILRDRAELQLEDAKILLSDTDVEIRYYALDYLATQGLEMSDEVIRQALRVRKSNRSLFLADSVTFYDDEYYQLYRENRFNGLRYEQILNVLDSRGAPDDVPLLALIRNTKKGHLDGLRRNIDSDFSEYFEEELATIRRLESSDIDNYVSRFERIRGFRLQKIMDHALHVLCLADDRQDLERVRRVLSDSVCLGSYAVMGYLEKYGDWSDIPRLVDLKNKYDNGLFILLPEKYSADETRAKTIAKLSKGRVIDILKYDMNPYISSLVLKYITNTEIDKIDDGDILEVFDKESRDYSENFVIRCVSVLSRKRLSGLLQRYIERDGPYYYNIVHWLDLGVSLPKVHARAIAQHALGVG